MKRADVVGIAVIAFVMIACGDGAKPSASPAAPLATATAALASSSGVLLPSAKGPTAPPTLEPAATTSPTTPADLGRVATKDVDGIRFRVELERNPLPAGEVSWVKVSVANRGRSNVTWFHDGCADLAGVGGQSATAWPTGVERSGYKAQFKADALGGSKFDAPEPFAWIDFVPEAYLGKGGYGCADIGLSDTIKPGETRVQTRWWSGFDSQNRSLPPGGPTALHVYAGFYWRGKQPEDIPASAIKFTLPGWIEARDQRARLSPAAVIDAALDDAAFSAFLATQDMGTGREAMAWYVPATDTWEVGLIIWHDYDQPRIRGVSVDAATGGILGSIDRAWDQDADGFP